MQNVVLFYLYRNKNFYSCNNRTIEFVKMQILLVLLCFAPYCMLVWRLSESAFYALTPVGAFFYFWGKSMEYKREVLSQINIHSLRTIGRDVGVKAPTALTKSVLIDEIIKIQSGEKKPCVPSKTGRPAGRCITEIQVNSNPNEKLNIIKIKKQAKRELINDILKEIAIKLEKMI